MSTDVVDRLQLSELFYQNGNFTCYMRKGDALKRENYGGLKLTDQILKTVDIALLRS